MAAADTNDTVPGMDRLLHLAVVHIHRLVRLRGNQYLVKTVEEETLFNLKENGFALTGLTAGRNRGFRMDAVDCQGYTAFSLRRPGMFIAADKVEMSMNGQLVTVVRKKPTCLASVLSINDANDTPTLRLREGPTDYKFKLQTLEKVTIGSINKTYRGFLKEMFSYADHYVITFPMDMDVRYKVAVISACVFINYKFHDN